VDAPEDLVLDIDSRIEGMTEFQIIGHHLEYVGICPACSGRLPAADA
jgi:Fe2+ or Zn2+ uptake regulation protein